MHPPRKVTETSQAVDDGLAMLSRAGRIKAATFMIERGVRFQVVVRVLQPGARNRPKLAN